MVSELELVPLNYTDLENGQWLWQDGNTIRSLAVQSLLKLDEAEAALQMTHLGHGICWLPNFFFEKYLVNQQLVRLFDGRVSTPAPLRDIYPRSPYENYRMRLFIDMANPANCLVNPLQAPRGNLTDAETMTNWLSRLPLSFPL